jgi:predicted ATPase/DNA-binding XRE family transcriptional regulator
MQDRLSFGRLVKRYRRALGLTQDALAERVGCAPQTIRKLEAGERRPSYQMAARLAQMLELSPDERAAFLQATPAAEKDMPSAPLELQRPTQVPRILPTYVTAFVGREQEQEALAQLLALPDHRLISLVGPGGIGKTRLAVEVAAQAAGFVDGSCFVPLAPLREPSAIVPAIADALALAASGATDLAAQLLAHLRDKQLLLLLDNLEHLLGADDLTVGLLGQILAQSPKITLLVTSRERLRLQAEWVVDVAGLSVPPAASRDGLASYPSVLLFCEHARRVQHGFRLEAGDEQAVAEICRLVAGLPLGIELAAAWVRVLSPQEIAQELARGLATLSVSPRDLPERHRSLQAVFDHSWRLLSAAERRVLRRLAVFRGGCTREAAADVAGASLAALATLVDKSLLRRAGVGHYDLHELIRQFALARLEADRDEHGAVRARHSAYYAAWLQRQAQPLQGPQLLATVAELSAEIDNVRAAWGWAVAERRVDDIERSVETLHWFCEYRSWFQEGEALFRQATDSLGEAGTPRTGATLAPGQDEAGQTRVLAHALTAHGYLASRLGQFDAALGLLERSLALVPQGDDSLTRSRALAYRGIVTYQMGAYSLARHSLLESLRSARGRADDWTAALCLTWLSMVEHALGDYEAAERAFREALALWRAIGNPRTTLFCITFCSIALVAQGKHSEAQALLHESLALSTASDDRWGTAMALHHLGLVAYAQQEYQEAVYLFGETLALLRTTGTQWEIARTITQLGMSLAALGQTAQAEAAYREALTTAMAAQALPDTLHALAGLAALRADEHRYEAALELVVYIQQQAASRTETRTYSANLQAAIAPKLSRAQVAAVEERMRQRSLAEVVAALLTPAT